MLCSRAPMGTCICFVEVHPCAIQGQSSGCVALAASGHILGDLSEGRLGVSLAPLALSLRLLLGVAAPQGTRLPCQRLHQLSPPNPLRTSRIFSPSHRRPGVWSGFLGRKRTDKHVRASLCSLRAWHYNVGLQSRTPGACTWPPPEAGAADPPESLLNRGQL